MPYIDTDNLGNIVGVFSTQQRAGQEFIATDPVLFVHLQLQAQLALNKSDITMLRCIENNVVIPSAWTLYRKALRAIANGADKMSTVLPVQPEYPLGT